jgi:tetratricopeptide (TPR) repeat protein
MREIFLAKEALEKANHLLPRHAENLRSLGWVKVMLGQLEEGRNDLRDAISLDLVNPLAYLDLAMSYFNHLEFKEGFEWLERAKALNPNDPFVLQNYKIAKDMEKDASQYSKNQIAQLKKERLKEWQASCLYILERFHRGKILTKDDESEIQRELENLLSQDFLLKNEKTKKDDEFFDDCPICQLMKMAKEQGREPTEEEIKQAFKKAKENGAIVGGKWFENSKENQK